MITIHDSLSYTLVAYIKDGEGNMIKGDAEAMKIVGLHFNSWPNPSLHI